MKTRAERLAWFQQKDLEHYGIQTTLEQRFDKRAKQARATDAKQHWHESGYARIMRKCAEILEDDTRRMLNERMMVLKHEGGV